VQDLAAAGAAPDLEELEWIHSHKTGALFIAAAELGGAAAGARPKAMEALHRFAKNLGLAFQITDDLLDYTGDPARIGKDARQDRERTTFVSLCGIEGARRLADELIDAAVGALAPLGKRALTLRALAELIRVRDR
jgi:farnesyl diphosphate synthase/geranylgeranyl diphosphate synthase type II